ncbi:hypothetical protein N665_0383s0082 [Sinapis alba]|nr:hypothetical protein N665_0383s0082 [Sinapis alba]
MIEEIANDVMDKLLLTPSKDSENFIGIEDHIGEMRVLLQLESEDVRMVGLGALLGLARLRLQEFCSTDFLDTFKRQKVLIFIDDFDDQVVLDALVGQTQWFGWGSRIIVVTNDKHFVRAHGIDHIYKVCLPSEKLALEMLCQYAFKKKSPPEGFNELAVKVTRLAGSLPLGLSVLGSFLRGRDKEYWTDLLPRLQNGIDGKIEKTLRVIYEGLRSETDKLIFRHIACLFDWSKVTNLKLLLTDFDLSVNVGLTNLADKSLIQVKWGIVMMHHLLQEMGRSIVRLEEPKNREFILDSEDIYDLLKEGSGTQKVLGISLDTDEIDELHVHAKAFRRMGNLRFLKIYSKNGLTRKLKLQLPKSFDYLAKLKLLHWDKYPMRCMPSKFRPENLVELRMCKSKLEKLWEGVVSLTCLKNMDLSSSHKLREILDLSTALNLETLFLVDCYSLVKLPSSIPNPNKLATLNMTNCRNSETIPIGISLKSLDILFLGGCSRLRTFPQISTNISYLSIEVPSIKEFPSNLHIENLFYLSIESLKRKKQWEKVKTFSPPTAMMSPTLVIMHLSNIPSLVELPCSFQNLHQLEELVIRNCVNLETLPTGMNLKSLDSINLMGCSRLNTFPDISTNIRKLVLSKTAIEKVPWWIEKFKRLSFLNMYGCNKLEYVNLNISKLTRLEKVDFSKCKALTGAFIDSPTAFIDFTKCFNLDQEALFQQRTCLGCQLWLSGDQVPSYFTHHTTRTSSYLTLPLLASSLSQPFLRFRTCIVFNCKLNSYIIDFNANFRFTGSFLNSFGQTQDFMAETGDYVIKTCVNHSCLLIFDCCISLEMKSDPEKKEWNYDHMNLRIHNVNDGPTQVEEWGIRILEADNQLANPRQYAEGNVLDEAREGGGNDVVTERSCTDFEKRL